MQSRKTFPNNSCSDPWEQIFLIWAFFEQLKKTSSHLWILLLGVTTVEIHTREADRVKQRAHLYWCAIKRNKVREQSNLHWGEILGNTPRGYTDTVTKDKGNMAVFIHTDTLKGIGNTWITSHRWKQSKQQHTMKPQGHRYRQKGGRGLSGICMTDVNFCANTCKILWAVIKVASFDFEGNGRRSWFALIFYSFATFLFADVW